MHFCCRCFLVALTLSLGAVNSPAAQGETNPPAAFPFVLPWDDDTPTATDFRALMPVRPATNRVVATPDGHFAAHGERVRFLGVNLSFSGGMPEKTDAPKVAGRLAKFGVNVARFHHMDTGAWPRGIRSPAGPGTGKLSPEALERMDFFVAELARRGIYANLNLLVGRPFNSGDGLPREIEGMDWKDRQIVACFDPRMLELQKDYARALLTRTNAFTGLPPARDPAVAFVEILNEQGLVHGWLGGEVDKLPEVFASELRAQWNAWLKATFKTTARLREAWSAGSMPTGAEMLANTHFAGGLDRWEIERHDNADLAAEAVTELPPVLAGDLPARAVRLEVKRPGTQSFHLQFNQRGLSVRGGQACTLEFWVKSAQPATLTAAVSMNHAPWNQLGLHQEFKVTPEWQRQRFVFNVPESDANARLNFSGFDPAAGAIWLAGISLRPGGVAGLPDGEDLEHGLPCFTKARFGERTAAAQRDWIRFLHDTEERYWTGMRRYLKEDLRVAALITGTIAGCAPLNQMAEMDWVDGHAYWQHPRFPGRPWDAANWLVENRSMVNEPGGTLTRLAGYRVLGRPFAVTEYNHPAPNTYASEGFLLLGAFAALQDWDAIYVYSYAHDRAQGWDSRRINGFFDVDQHPTKMASLIATAALFRRGDLPPAKELVAAHLPVDQELDLLRNARNWTLVNASQLGLAPETALINRVAIATGRNALPAGAKAAPFQPAQKGRFAADQGQMVWDLSQPGRGLVSLNTERSKAVIGYGGGQSLALGSVTIEPGTGIQEGWCAITLTALDPPGQPARWLVTATGYAENTDMRWGNAEKSTVGRDWGRAPSRVEGIPAKLKFAGRAVQAWALDERGQRTRPLPIQPGPDGSASLEIGPAWQTLWYEVATR